MHWCIAEWICVPTAEFGIQLVSSFEFETVTGANWPSLIKVMTAKGAGCWHFLGFSHCDTLSDTPDPALSTMTFQPLSVFPQESLSLCHLSPSLAIFLLSKSNSLSPLSLYCWACILTQATSTRNNALCLNVAGHPTWPSTVFWRAVRTGNTLDDSATRWGCT